MTYPPGQEKHTDPSSFGKSLAAHALEHAREQSGLSPGQYPTSPVEFQVTVTVSPGSWAVSLNFGSTSVSYSWA